MYHGNLAATVAKFFCNDKVSLAWNIRHSLYELKSENFATRQIIKMNKLLSNRADAIFYNSKISLTQHENFGFNSHSSILNPNGFDTNILKPSFETKELIRRELGILDNDTVIGHVARYHPMKDHITFVKALIKVMVERSDVVALMIGREVKSGTAFLINDLPETITSRFYFLGERSDVYDLMQSMDVLCLTSAWGEGFPNVLGEAMSMSIPCISTDIADSSEIIGDTGIVVPPGKPCSLADAIFAFLSMSSSEKVTLGRAARERIEKKFLMQVNVECYEAIYEKLSKLYASTK